MTPSAPLERVPLGRDTGTLITAARAQREATDGVERLLDRVTGQAEDPDGTVAALVSARGELLDLWLREDAVHWGPERLGELIVQTAQAAARQATQRAYDTLAPLLGDTVTAAMEGIDPAEFHEEDDLFSFDPSTLRSDW